MSRLLRVHVYLVILAGLAMPPLVCAQDDAPVTDISTVPRAEPDPPLRYMLVPEYIDLVPGNAATYYYRAVISLPDERQLTYGETQSKWLALPLGEFPVDQAREWLKSYDNVLAEVKVASYRTECDWDIPSRELTGAQIFSRRLLPEINDLRHISRVLRVKARLEIAEGRFDDAHQTLIMGYQMTAQLSKSPLIIHQLVGVAIAQLTNESVRDWITAGGPNLYWGLASLPSPFVDMRTAIRLETTNVLRIFPYLRDPETLQYSPQRWRSEIAESLQQFSIAYGKDDAAVNAVAQTTASIMIMSAYPAAKAALIESGMDADTVEKMPVGQVVAIQTAWALRKVIDETTKWTFLPYWQSYRPMEKSIQELHDSGYLNSDRSALHGAIPLAGMMIPGTQAMTLGPARLDRDIAALQTIEAIRMTAAAHDNQLPQSLSELENCPAPIDPITGAPFIYRVEDGRAVLELPPPVGRSHESFGKVYRILLRTAQQ